MILNDLPQKVPVAAASRRVKNLDEFDIYGEQVPSLDTKSQYRTSYLVVGTHNGRSNGLVKGIGTSIATFTLQ